MSEVVYKIVLKNNGNFKTLFRAIEGSRTLPFDKWLKGVNVMAIDGSGGKVYLTGIDCFKEKKVAEIYLSNFRKELNRVIIKCLAKGLRQKPTNKDIFLADEIFIPQK